MYFTAKFAKVFRKVNGRTKKMVSGHKISYKNNIKI